MENKFTSFKKKKRTQEQMDALAFHIYELKNSGKTSRQLAEQFTMHVTQINKLYRRHIKNMENQESDGEISEIVSSEFIQEGAFRHEKMEIFVYSEQNPSHHIKLEIEKPIEKNIDAFNKKLSASIFEQLRFSISGLSFNVNL